MRLSSFITENKEQISQEWEAFARTLKPGELALRDHIDPILDAIAADIETAQSQGQRDQKGKGGAASPPADSPSAAQLHAIERAAQLFSIDQLVAEFRALRASVLRLWFERLDETVNKESLAEITRFNESIDQALAESVGHFSVHVQESRDLFLAILSHDLRNPLSAIKNFSEVLDADANVPSDKVKLVARRIKGSVDRLTKMVNGLLDFARTRFGTILPIDRESLALDQLCGEIVNEMRGARSTADIALRTSGDLTGYWDRVRLGQLISNLVGNAIEHGAEDRPITVTVGGNESEVTLSVHNEGAPIPKELRPSIFKPFVHAPLSRTSKGSGGLGLGLYIAYQIVIAHGGAIHVDSEASIGTTFKVSLPRSKP